MLLEVEIPDVDLDVSDRDKALGSLRGFVQASQFNNGIASPHNSGVYFQRIPVDPTNSLSAFPFKEAEYMGFFKVDIIPNHVYDLVESNDELDELIEAPIDWDWFLDTQFYINEDSRYTLTHLGRHHALCCQYPPQSVNDLAALLALIRPRKRYLIGRSWDEILEVVWQQLDDEDDVYFFKKSHGIAFGVLVAVHAKLIARHLKLPVPAA